MSLESRRSPLMTLASLGAAVLLGAPVGAHASIIGQSGHVVKLYTDDGRFVRDMPVDQGHYWYGITNGPGTDVLVVGARQVERYDGLTGDYKGRFAELPAGADSQGSGAGFVSGAYRPGGELVGAATFLEESQRYDATTGAYLGTVGTPGNHLNGPEPIDAVFGPDGDLYVGSVGPQGVLRFDGATYAPEGVFATNPLPGSWGQGAYAGNLAFGPDGDLYASDYAGHRVVRFDGRTGSFKGLFSEEGAVVSPGDLAFSPAGDLLVTDHEKNQVLRLDGLTGAVVGVFADGFAPRQLVHVQGDAVPVPEPATWAAWVLVGLGALAVRARRGRGA